MRHNRFFPLTVALILVLMLGAIPATAQDDLELAILILNWLPYGEHVPFYYGLEQGYYAEEGINLIIQPGGGSGRTIQAVGSGQGDFGYADTPAVIRGIGEGIPVRSIGVLLQRNPSAVQFFCDEGIETPQDLRGRSIAVTPGDAVYQTLPAFLAANGLTVDDVELVNVDPAGKIAALIEGRADTLIGFAHDQAPTIEKLSGQEVCMLRYPDFGVDFLSSGLLTHTDTLTNKPELVAAFLRATIRSWEEATANPEEAAAVMSEQVLEAPAEDVLLHQWQLATEFLHSEATEGWPPGINAGEDWQATLDILAEYAGLANPGAPSDYWDGSFAPEFEPEMGGEAEATEAAE